ncbi:hypothetical protein ACHAWF_001183, partial [Thalassiosira exigua]
QPFITIIRRRRPKTAFPRSPPRVAPAPGHRSQSNVGDLGRRSSGVVGRRRADALRGCRNGAGGPRARARRSMTSAFVSWAVLLSAAHVVEARNMARLGPPRSALSAFRRHLGRRPPSAAAPSAAFAHRRPHRRTAADATARSQVPWNGFRSVSPMNSRPSTTGRFPRSTRPVSASAFESPGGEDGPDESVEPADDSSTTAESAEESSA